MDELLGISLGLSLYRSYVTMYIPKATENIENKFVKIRQSVFEVLHSYYLKRKDNWVNDPNEC